MQGIRFPIYVIGFFLAYCSYAQTPAIEQVSKDLERLEGEEYFATSNELLELYLDSNVEMALDLAEDRMAVPIISINFLNRRQRHFYCTVGH